MTSGFRRIERRSIFEGRIIELSVDTFEAPDGERFTREIVHHRGAVAVVPVTAHGTVVMIRQYRPSVDSVLLEVPAGVRDVEGEALIDTARRELREEVGIEAASLEPLCEIVNAPGFSDERIAIYMATGLTHVGHDLQGPEERHIEVVEVPFELAAIRALIADGQITNAIAVTGLLMAATRIG